MVTNNYLILSKFLMIFRTSYMKLLKIKVVIFKLDFLLLTFIKSENYFRRIGQKNRSGSV